MMWKKSVNSTVVLRINWLRRRWQSFLAHRSVTQITVLKVGIPVSVLLLAFVFGYKASRLWAILIVGGTVAAIAVSSLLQKPFLGLYAFVPVALIGRFELNTGTAVVLNPITLFVPTLFVIWMLDMMRRRAFYFVPSCTNKSLLFFVFANLASLFIGIVLWDPAVPRPAAFIVIQLAQWAIFAFSALAYWMMGNLVRDETCLRRLVMSYLIIAGVLSILFVVPSLGYQVYLITSGALYRTPFWVLLLAVAGGQLLFNQGLSSAWRLFLSAVIIATQVFALYWNQEQASTWASLFATAGVLAWLRWPRLRWPVIVLLVALLFTGVLSSALYEFAGGDDEWELSGGSRLVLAGRVIEVTMRNPVTGLGPAAYRVYAGMKPLQYGRAFWVHPNISSHNNYVDLFSHGGLLGIGMFVWFVVQVTRLGLHLRTRFTEGFTAGYLNAMLAAGVGSLLLMAFVDWMLPFVYNVAFVGFQASVLVWFFLGGLVVLEKTSKSVES